MAKPAYDEQVFINCPFDGEYRPMFEALVFAVHDCGFVARCALELQDASQVRIDKIERLIGACRLGNPRHLQNGTRFSLGIAAVQHAA